jgi:hypothetical protein
MAKCDREEQRWAQAYVAEVINLAELKGYRSEIATRRHSLLAQRHGLQTDLENIGHALEHVEALRGYCERVRQQLQTFDPAEKRQAFEALNVRITWTPGQPLTIEGTIPLDEIVPVPLERIFCFFPRRKPGAVPLWPRVLACFLSAGTALMWLHHARIEGLPPWRWRLQRAELRFSAP